MDKKKKDIYLTFPNEIHRPSVIPQSDDFTSTVKDLDSNENTRISSLSDRSIRENKIEEKPYIGPIVPEVIPRKGLDKNNMYTPRMKQNVPLINKSREEINNLLTPLNRPGKKRES